MCCLVFACLVVKFAVKKKLQKQWIEFYIFIDCTYVQMVNANDVLMGRWRWKWRRRYLNLCMLSVFKKQNLRTTKKKKITKYLKTKSILIGQCVFVIYILVYRKTKI